MTTDMLAIPGFLNTTANDLPEARPGIPTKVRPVTLTPLDAAADGAGPQVLERSSPLLQVSVRLSARAGETELTIGELTAARAGDVLKLDRLVDQPIDLMLNDSVVARGVLVAIDDHFAVRLTELPAPLRF